MYYEDNARRFNFASGMLLGAVLGAGIALITRPRERLRKPDRIRRGGRRAARRVESGAARLRSGGLGGATRAISAARERLGV